MTGFNSWTYEAHDGSLQSFLQELQALHRNLVTGRFDAPPDGRGAGDDFHIRRERLDHHVLLVADGFERGGDGLPIDVIVARCAAVAAASMKMAECLAGLADG